MGVFDSGAIHRWWMGLWLAVGSVGVSEQVGHPKSVLKHFGMFMSVGHGDSEWAEEGCSSGKPVKMRCGARSAPRISWLYLYMS